MHQTHSPLPLQCPHKWDLKDESILIEQSIYLRKNGRRGNNERGEVQGVHEVVYDKMEQ